MSRGVATRELLPFLLFTPQARGDGAQFTLERLDFGSGPTGRVRGRHRFRGQIRAGPLFGRELPTKRRRLHRKGCEIPRQLILRFFGPLQRLHLRFVFHRQVLHDRVGRFSGKLSLELSDGLIELRHFGNGGGLGSLGFFPCVG